jgi:glycosyltransferase involved in cell wall biosynthesis
LEALAVGVPVVVSDLPWVHEPDYHEARLAVVSDASVETLAGALVAAVLAPEPEDVEANRSLVARRFDREVLFGSVGDEYERLAGDRRPKTHARRSA